MKLARNEGVVTVTLDRPERGNALSAALVDELIEGVARASADEQAHTLVLRGEGRHFCTGFDLGEIENESDATLLARFVRIELLLDAVWRAPMRTVAIAQGRVTGAGADLFAACDLRFLHSGANLRFPGAGFGIALGTRRLAARVGADRALRWVSDATTISAADAIATGLASAVVNEPEAPVPPMQVSRASYAQLRAALVDAERDSDLAALVRSAAAPGLRERIVAYRDRALGARSDTR